MIKKHGNQIKDRGGKKGRKDEKEGKENMQKKKHERKNTIPSEFDYRKNEWLTCRIGRILPELSKMIFLIVYNF